MAHAVTEGTDTEVLVSDRSLPDGDPATLPPAPDDDVDVPDGEPVRPGSSTTRRARRPTPRAPATATGRCMSASVGMSERLGLAEDDRFALVFPFTHIAGGVYIYAAVAYGLTFVLDEAFDPGTTLDLLRRENITQGGAGTFFHQMYLKAQQDLPAGERLFPHVRTFPGGGAPKPPSLHYELKEAFGVGVVSGYGMTEAPILTMNRHDASDEVLATTEGPAVAGTTLRLVTLDGKEAGVGEEGEIRAKGPQVTLGYLDPSLDADAFDDDGWFRTGDLGVLDADGNLTITGRLKDIIIRKGENISAKEVEDLLFTHPQVADVAVIGLPDADSGERACAVVVAAPGVDPISFDEMKRHLLDVGPHHPQAARAARARRRPAPQPVGQDRQVPAAAAVLGLSPGQGRRGRDRRAVEPVQHALEPATPLSAPTRWPLTSSRWQAPSPSHARLQPSGSTLASARIAPGGTHRRRLQRQRRAARVDARGPSRRSRRPGGRGRRSSP